MRLAVRYFINDFEKIKKKSLTQREKLDMEKQSPVSFRTMGADLFLRFPQFFKFFFIRFDPFFGLYRCREECCAYTESEESGKNIIPFSREF